MNTYNTLYTNQNSFQQFIQTSNIQDCENNLIQIFCGIPNRQYIKNTLHDISSVLPKSKLIGTTTAGEIIDDRVCQNSTVISITTFEKTVLTSCLIEGYGDDFKLGESIATRLITPKTKVLILFSDGLISDGEKLLKGINKIDQNIIIVGGRAGDNGVLKESFVFDRENIINYGAVCVGLDSNELHITNHYALDWQPIGKDMIVSKVKNSRVYEIDGVSVRDIYQKYLGEDVARELPFSSSEFPLLKKNEDGLDIARALITIFDDGSASFIGSLNEGDRVKFGFGNINAIMKKTDEHIDKITKKPVESIFIYSCLSRINLLQNKIINEIKPFSSVANCAGFFTYGEYFSHKDKKELLNVTMTILALSESNNIEPQKSEKTLHDIKTNNMIKDKHYKVISALTTLINSVTDELKQEHNKLIKLLKKTEQIANKDHLTGAYNRYFFYGSAKQSFLKAKRNNTPLAIAILDIDKFKHINDTYGHDIGDLALVEVSNIIKSSLRDSDLYARFGGEEFCILLENISCKSTKVVFEKMREKFEKNSIKIDHTYLPCTVSIGVYYGLLDSLEMMIKEADKQLFLAKDNGRNQIKIKANC